MSQDVERPGEGVVLEDDTSIKRPRRYKVLLLNDHYTTMDFVVRVLVEIFRRTPEDAERIMLSVHRHGIGVAGVYAKELAEAKVLAAHKCARDEGYPFRCDMEPE
jgi:ATP-dependent Clp protease adaptor protein ClpS